MNIIGHMLNIKKTNNLRGENMKTYTIQFKDTLIKNKIRVIETDDQDVVEYYVSKYWSKQIDNLVIFNNSENLKMDYDNTPAVARKERANV